MLEVWDLWFPDAGATRVPQLIGVLGYGWR
jgi:hypothetical protein